MKKRIFNISEKNTIQLITLFMQVIIVFFTIFFNVYVYEISQNINIVLLYSLFQVAISFIADFVIAKVATKNSLKAFYRVSFALAIAATGLVFTISTDRIYMVFITQFVYALASSFYFWGKEVAIMDKNNTKQMNKYYGINIALTLIVSTLSPFISGYVMQYVSYYILLAIIIVCALACFVLSFNIKNFCENDQRMKFGQYFKQSRQIKSAKIGLWAYGLFKFSQDGMIDILLPILILIRTGGSFSVGLYSALATFVSGGVLLLYVYFCKRKDIAIWICTCLLSCSSLALIFWSDLVCFFIYYFVKKIAFQILKNSLFSNIFTFTNGTELECYKIEQRMTYCIYNRPLTMLSYCLALLIYNFVNNEISITIILVTLALIQILSTSLFVWGEKIKKIESTTVQQPQLDEIQQ